jgi:hypothetical protein
MELPRQVPATSPVRRIMPNDDALRVSIVANRHHKEHRIVTDAG